MSLPRVGLIMCGLLPMRILLFAPPPPRSMSALQGPGEKSMVPVLSVRSS